MANCYAGASMKVEELRFDTDIQAFIDISREMQQECEPIIPFDEVEVAANSIMIINDLDRVNINAWIIKRDDKIIAFSIGRIGRYMFSQATVASMVFWYVRREYRKTRAAFELLHTFQNWAALNNAFRIEVGAAKVGVSEAVKINGIFKKRGLRSYGELFYKDLQKGIEQ